MFQATPLGTLWHGESILSLYYQPTWSNFKGLGWVIALSHFLKKKVLICQMGHSAYAFWGVILYEVNKWEKKS